MKERILRKLKIWLFIILAVVLIVGGYVLVEYNKDPNGFANKMNDYWNSNILKSAQEQFGININKTEENIELPEKEKLTEAQRYYYFQQLTETGKKIYVTIEKNIDKMIDGEDNIPLPESLGDIAKSKGKEYVAEEFQNAWDAFMTDKSEYFYIDSSKVCLITEIRPKGKSNEYKFSIGKGDYANYFIEGFSSRSDVARAASAINREADHVLKSTKGTTTEKIKYIHDYIIDNTEYDNDKSADSDDIYGCMINKKAICEGYARTFKYYMDRLNIPCILVSGTAVDDNGHLERHAWNYVCIDENWYAVDTTWDDPIIIGSGALNEKIKYKYFLKGMETMKKDHTTEGEISKGGKEFEFPTLATNDLI